MSVHTVIIATGATIQNMGLFALSGKLNAKRQVPAPIATMPNKIQRNSSISPYLPHSQQSSALQLIASEISMAVIPKSSK